MTFDVTNAAGNLIEVERGVVATNERLFVGMIGSGDNTVMASATQITDTAWVIALGTCDPKKRGIGYSATVWNTRRNGFDLAGYLVRETGDRALADIDVSSVDDDDGFPAVMARMRTNADGSLRLEVVIGSEEGVGMA
ncbi:hypothetical protein [Burkholderia cenocepacia]|uniref:hypothetical protein n=1 Tax=Burkholderia cenocepacia TaxID=95486 RepID=UPI002231E70F|nr:hypothetical protein [Burkholderia cenocepacia]MCW3677813.1 hypothetical protein [Burkholderia cenocepacia]